MTGSLNSPLAQHLQQLLNGTAYTPDDDTETSRHREVVRAVDPMQGVFNAPPTESRDGLLRDVCGTLGIPVPSTRGW